MTLKDILIAGKLTISEGGGGGDTLAERCNNTLTVYHSDDVIGLQGAVFQDCTSLVGLVLPNLASLSHYGTMQSCSNLEYADIGGTFERVQIRTFQNCAKLSVIVIRNATVAGLANTNALDGTPFASGKSGGTLYVPQSLISTYESTSNWSTILGYADNQIKAIEGSIYENAYADGTPIA